MQIMEKEPIYKMIVNLQKPDYERSILAYRKSVLIKNFP